MQDYTMESSDGGSTVVNYTSYTASDPTATNGAYAMMGAFFATYFLFIMIFLVLVIAAYWKIFSKANKPGWAAIIPIYNILVLLQVIQKPWWWLLLLCIPFVNIIVQIVIALDLAKAFGRSVLFAIFLLIILQPIGALVLAFGGSKYQLKAKS